MKDLIERALQRELAFRRELRPHAQLGVAPNAPATIIDDAYARLENRYQADAFAEYGDDAVAAATSIVALLRTSYEQMRGVASLEHNDQLPTPALESRPRADETLRALATLRAAIARRIDDARAHRDGGRIADAIRLFESVMILDRHNAVARQSLIELRQHRARKTPTIFGRLLARVFGHGPLHDRRATKPLRSSTALADLPRDAGEIFRLRVASKP